MTSTPDRAGTSAGDQPPDLAAVRAAAVPVLVRNMKGCVGLCLVALLLYAVADFRTNRHVLGPLYALLLAQLVVLGVARAALARVRTWRQAVTLPLVTLALLFALGVVSDWLSDNMQSTALTGLAASVITAAIMPWGPWPQLAMAILCGLTSGSAVFLIRGSLEGLDHAVVAAVLLLGGSVYAAHAGERSRLSALQAQWTLVAERERRTGLEKEKEIGELKARFVSMASHEFRTPLASILASAEALGRYMERMAPEDRRARVAMIRQQVQWVTRLLEDVLTLGQVHDQGRAFAPRPVDLAVLCREVVAEVEATAQTAHRLVLMTAGLRDQVLADPRLMRHVVRSLLDNALKYSPGGSAVECAQVREHGRVSLRVSDSGIGIPPADQPHLFDGFHRGSNVGNVPGTGLGLAIAKRVLDLHEGTIAVDSTVGVGTSVTVTLAAAG